VENGTNAAADVREGQLKLMEECLATTSPIFAHAAVLSGLSNIT
jgi:hypothetical protein